MNSENPSWILVEGSNPETIQKAVIAHAKICRPERPGLHRVKVFKQDGNRFGVMFDPPAPPYAFANLIGWLDDPKMNRGARRAIGWLVAPGDGTRFFLAQKPGGTGGDTLVGVASDGRSVSVFLPDCSVTLSKAKVVAIPEPELPAADAGPVVEFEVVLDSNTAFGNPQFVIG
jgi:hypothetical protein